MQAAGRNKKQLFDEINITPLTDIFLVLLIIMMVVAPMMQQLRQDVKPPQLQGGAPVEQNKLMVEVVEGGTIYVQGQETTPDQLVATLKEQEAILTAKNGVQPQKEAADKTDDPLDKSLIIRADKATKSGQVLKIFEAARDAGFTKVTVAGDPLDASRQSELQQNAASSNTGGHS